LFANWIVLWTSVCYLEAFYLLSFLADFREQFLQECSRDIDSKKYRFSAEEVQGFRRGSHDPAFHLFYPSKWCGNAPAGRPLSTKVWLSLSSLPLLRGQLFRKRLLESLSWRSSIDCEPWFPPYFPDDCFRTRRHAIK